MSFVWWIYGSQCLYWQKWYQSYLKPPKKMGIQTRTIVFWKCFVFQNMQTSQEISMKNALSLKAVTLTIINVFIHNMSQSGIFVFGWNMKSTCVCYKDTWKIVCYEDTWKIKCSTTIRWLVYLQSVKEIPHSSFVRGRYLEAFVSSNSNQLYVKYVPVDWVTQSNFPRTIWYLHSFSEWNFNCMSPRYSAAWME